MPPAPKWRKRLFRGCGCGCGGAALLVALAVALCFFLLGKVPKTYPPAAAPIPPPDGSNTLGGGLDGFSSPYLGHTGSWDGKGGAMLGGSKLADLEAERSMGLRWTFMPVHWQAMEPKGPVDLHREVPPAWQELDAFVIAAHERGLNILMQAPVIGGNAGGPPKWAGSREPGKSAPANMEAVAEFAAKLASRYGPSGTLPKKQGWGARYGVRAWELDNEPESYRTHWKGQGADYAEFVTRVSGALKAVDPEAVILTPALAGGGGHGQWLEDALDSRRLAGSPSLRQGGVPYSIGRATGVVSFHCYEGLETAFSGQDRTIERDFTDIRAIFEKWEQQSPEFSYGRKQEYWHTEGNFDFLGVLSAQRRAAWRFQFFTRAFAAGIRKVIVMDPSKPEQSAVRAYIRVLPNPFPMTQAAKELSVLRGQVSAFMHSDGPEPGAGRVWAIWALASTGDASVEIPMVRPQAQIVTVDGRMEQVAAGSNRVRLELKGDAKMAPPVLVVDREPRR